ncbi:MAG: hypothetical protein ACI89M_001186, partial [Chitinophagales bacterium]
NNMIEVNFGKFGDPVPGAPSVIEQAGLGFSFQNVGETLILGGEITVKGEGKIGKVPLTILAGYTYVKPKSLNWEEELTLYDVNGAVLTDFPSRIPGDISYQSTSSGDNNILKYRNPHVFTVDMQSTFRKIDFGISIQYRSWMENIDYAFVSDLFLLAEGSLGTSAFSALKEFRTENEGRGTTLLSARIIYHFTEKASLGIIGNNLLNLTYADRPAYLGQPLNFNARFSYKFTGKNRDKKVKGVE